MVDINTIADPQVRLFYTLFLSQRTILRDFYVALPEEQYDYRMVDTRVETLYLIRDHDILHVGWNLALMDHLGMERFSSLREYWG